MAVMSSCKESLLCVGPCGCHILLLTTCCSSLHSTNDNVHGGYYLVQTELVRRTAGLPQPAADHLLLLQPAKTARRSKSGQIYMSVHDS
jgi:hypothetical protein